MNSFFVKDDTLDEFAEKIADEEKAKGLSIHVTGIGIVIDREQTTAVYDGNGKAISGKKGKNAISDFVSKSGIPVFSVSGIRDVVGYLYEERIPVMVKGARSPIDDDTKSRFDEYIWVYGI